MTTGPIKKKGELPGLSADALAARGYNTPPNGTFMPRAALPTTHPRKVKNGLKLSTKSGPVTERWSGQRWMRLVEEFATPAAVAEGLVYARTGQTKTLTLNPGHVQAIVQGRMPAPYAVDIRLPLFTHEQWEQVIATMLDEARHIAGLLAGDVPSNIEDLFSPLRLKLFPGELSDLSVSCTCGQCAPGSATQGGWCKHVACVMSLIADRLGKDTFLIFALRGMQRDELLERLRAKRTSNATRSGEETIKDTRPVPAYLPRLPGLSAETSAPLEQRLADFWNAGPGLKQIELSMKAPAVTHPLLRRLGPSPFDQASGAKFPLVGLLATCYDVITESNLPKADETPQSPGD